MTEPSRLFDCIEWQLQNEASHPIFCAKENGQWKEYSIQEVSQIVNALGAGLLKMGFGNGDGTIEGKDKIAVIGKNRPEWVMLDLAVQQIGAVLTPVYPTINEQELEFILQDAQVKIIFVNDENLVQKVNNIKGNLPHLREIYSFDKIDQARNWKEILSMGDASDLENVKTISETIKYEDIATIIYTSG